MKKVTPCYPGWSSKAITFTIDDGNLVMDQKFLDIVRPAGIKGTFNLCSHNMNTMSAEEYRAFYEGYEIANHCKLHPYVFEEGVTYKFADEPFDEATADPNLLYETDRPQVYYIRMPKGWRRIAEPHAYTALIAEGQAELEAVFGKGSVRSFVWPFNERKNHVVKEYLDSVKEYYGVRRSGEYGAEVGFLLPENRMPWHYTATHKTLLEKAAQYEALPEDGTLKFFCFGVHSIDFERENKWDALAEFARVYGNRPQDYFYATVGEIFDYEDAVKQLVITEEAVQNLSAQTVYVRIDNEKIALKAGETYLL